MGVFLFLSKTGFVRLRKNSDRLCLALLLLSLFCGLTGFIPPLFSQETNNNTAKYSTRTVKVGVYENRPKLYTDSHDKKQGIYVEILSSVSHKTGWKIEYIDLEWPEYRSALESGKIDIMPDVAFTKERSEFLYFNKYAVLQSWSQIFVNKNSKIEYFSDLENKKIAVLKGSIQKALIEKILKSLSINTTLVDCRSFKETFLTAAQGKADAALTNNFFGNAFAPVYDLKKTYLVFDSVELHFASLKGKNKDIIDTIDKHLLRLRKENTSFYNKFLYKYLDKPATASEEKVDYRLFLSALFALFISLSAIVWLAKKLKARNFFLSAASKDLAEKSNQLKASSQELELLINKIPDALIYTDINRKIVRVNPAFIDLFKYKPFEILGKPTAILYAHSSDCDMVGDLIEKKHANVTSIFDGAMEFKKKDGSVFTGETKGSLLRDAVGKRIGCISLVKDVTEKKNLEKKLQQAAKMESIGRVAGGVAHDFNNILSVILGFGDLLMAELPDDNPHYELVAQIVEAAKKARDLTKQLLSFSKRGVFKVKKTDLNTLFDDFEKILTRLLPDNTDLVLDLYPSPVPVMINKGKLERVIMNMVINAGDALPEGGRITISTDMDKGSSCAVLRVDDTGTGMAPDVVQNIFEPFFTTKSKEHGTGLGLSTSYGIIKQHKGDITVTSEPGSGTRFEITLPIALEQNLKTQDFDIIGSSETKPINNPEDNTGKKILLVDDDELVRKLAEKILKKLNYTVYSADNGSKALELFNELDSKIDLLLTDMVMPGMTGRDLYEKIITLKPDIKVLFMSGYTNNMLDNLYIEKNKFHFLAKPFSIKALAKEIETLLS
jgi:PAS domain S-box-containing protein